MSAYDIACVVMGLPCLAALAYAANGAMRDRAAIDEARRERALIARATQVERDRRTVRRALAELDLPPE